MARVEIPEQPAGMTKRMVSNLIRSQDTTPRQKAEQALGSLATIWGGSDTLAGMAVVRAILDEMIAAEVAQSREDGWRSWAEIGASLGISKQAAQQRYSVKAD